MWSSRVSVRWPRSIIEIGAGVGQARQLDLGQHAVSGQVRRDLLGQARAGHPGLCQLIPQPVPVGAPRATAQSCSCAVRLNASAAFL